MKGIVTMKRFLITITLIGLISTTSKGFVLSFYNDGDIEIRGTFIGMLSGVTKYFHVDAYSLYSGGEQLMGSGLAFLTANYNKYAVKICIFENSWNYGWNTDGYFNASLNQIDGAYCCSWCSYTLDIRVVSAASPAMAAHRPDNSNGESDGTAFFKPLVKEILTGQLKSPQ